LRLELTKQVLDDKGNIIADKVIKLYPNLSLIQAGEVLTAYREFKRGDQRHTDGIKALKKLLNITDTSVEPIVVERDKYLAAVYEDLVEYGECSTAFTLYDDLFKTGKIKPSERLRTLLFRLEMKKHVDGIKSD